MGVGTALNQILAEKGMNVNELAKKARVSPSTLYSAIRRDNAKLDHDVMIRIAGILGVSPEYFYVGKEQLTPYESYVQMLEMMDITCTDAENGTIVLRFHNDNGPSEVVRLLKHDFLNIMPAAVQESNAMINVLYRRLLFDAIFRRYFGRFVNNK